MNRFKNNMNVHKHKHKYIYIYINIHSKHILREAMIDDLYKYTFKITPSQQESAKSLFQFWAPCQVSSNDVRHLELPGIATPCN